MCRLDPARGVGGTRKRLDLQPGAAGHQAQRAGGVERTLAGKVIAAPVAAPEHGEAGRSEIAGKLALLEGIARGEKAILEDRVVPHREARRRMARWLK
jgi:hypothetical protein